MTWTMWNTDRMICLLLLSFLLGGCAPGGDPEEGGGVGGTGGEVSAPVGPFLGQTPPGDTPEVFGPGFVTTGMYTRDLAMTPDGTELYFGVLLGPVAAIIQTRMRPDGAWTTPEVAPFSRDSRFFNLEPHISPDGSRFLFLSTRVQGREPTAEELRSWSNQDIWVMDREGEGWGEPYNLGPPVNTEGSEFFPSTTLDGTLYFTRGSDDGAESHIYRSRLVEGEHQQPERLGPGVNATPNQFNAFIAPDESYLILCTGGLEDSYGGTDYYVTFRSADDRWSGPINLGEIVNTPGSAEMSPYVSPDGRYFFFMSPRWFPREEIPESLSWEYLSQFRQMPETGNPGIYWMDAGFIEALRPEGF